MIGVWDDFFGTGGGGRLGGETGGFARVGVFSGLMH
jgi:hypothetical protein